MPSFFVRDNDVIEVRQRSKQMALIMESAVSGERDVPDYVEFDASALKGRFVRAPKLADVPYPIQMEPNLVIEFYSR